MNAITSIPAEAKYAGCSISTIAKGLRNGILIRGKDGAFNAQQLKEGLAAQSAKRGGRQLSDHGGMPHNLLAIREKQAKEDLRLTISKRKLSERALGIEEGKYMLSADAHHDTERLLITLKDSLLAMPNEIAGPSGGKPAREIAEIIRRRLLELLQALADGCVSHGLLKPPQKRSEHDMSSAIDQIRRTACEALHPQFGRRAADRVVLAEIEAATAQRAFETQMVQADRRAIVMGSL